MAVNSNQNMQEWFCKYAQIQLFGYKLNFKAKYRLNNDVKWQKILKWK
jgi:hypothetical protein